MTSELSHEDRELYQTVALPLTSVNNYPDRVGMQVWGTDMTPIIDAVFAALKREGYKKCEVASPPGTV